MLAVQPRRWLSRPRGLVVFAFTVTTLYWLMVHGSGNYGHVVQKSPGGGATDNSGVPRLDEQKSNHEEDSNHVPSFEDKMKEAQEEQQEAIRQQFRLEYDHLSR